MVFRRSAHGAKKIKLRDVRPNEAHAPARQPTNAPHQRIPFGAICPKEGKGAALVLPRCDTETRNLHLAEIATAVAPGSHAVLVVDQAGWHISDRLVVPANITILLLPPKCPELNPVENVWQFMRDSWLSNRIFNSYKDIVDHVATPGTNLSISHGKSCQSECAIGPTG